MVKVSKKPMKRDEIPASIFDALDRNASAMDGVQGNNEKVEATGPSIEDAMKQIAALNARIEEQDRVNMALTTTVPTQVQQPAPKSEELDMAGLPDPLDDAVAYAKEVQRRTVDHVNKQIKAQRDADEAASRERNNVNLKTDDLWNTFTDKYEDYAGDERKVKFAAQEAIDDAQRKGIDIQRYMYANSDRFMRDVAAKYDTIFGKPGEDTDGSDQSQDDDTSRTSGIFGGMESGNKGSFGSSPPVGDMIKDLHDVQKKSGFY